jgi:wyosine [tRNA(Phe)-imidazoG37] synthetase (radical SAM superfamily)
LITTTTPAKQYRVDTVTTTTLAEQYTVDTVTTTTLAEQYKFINTQFAAVSPYFLPPSSERLPVRSVYLEHSACALPLISETKRRTRVEQQAKL